MKKATQFIHAGIHPDSSTGAIMTPIFQTSTFVQEAPGKHKGYEYARTQNPTRTALEQSMAAIENGKYGLCFGSGMAAIDAIIRLLQPGDEVIASSDLYGGAYRLFTKIFAGYGIRFHFVDMSKATNIIPYLNENSRFLWVETPTNPLLHIIDLTAVTDIARKHGLKTIVDNTFASPYLQNPLDWGADLVVHSATKYLGGHSDVVLGVVVLNDTELAERLSFIQNSCGAIPGPHDCWLVLRGIKTLHVRMDRHCENGAAIARYLKTNNKIARVLWAGFDTHPNHEVAKKQMRGFGGMISFTLKEDSVEAAFRILKKTRLFSLAESLGGVESLIGHPASMTHAAIPREERIKNGLSDSLIRLSVGIEAADDLIADLDQAIG